MLRDGSTCLESNRGFTLMEALIYIFLLSILIVGVFAALFNIVQGMELVRGKVTVQEEGNFILRKIDWALTDVSVISSPLAGPPTGTLKVMKGGNQIDIQPNGDKVEIREGGVGSSFLTLSTDNVKVSNLQFQYISPSGGSPAGVTASFTIDGLPFEITKHIRK